jgi:translation initiation factor 4G
MITDINTILYSKGIESPNPELNMDAKEGKLQSVEQPNVFLVAHRHGSYNRDFLLHFMSLGKERPSFLPPLVSIGLELAVTCNVSQWFW